MYTTLKRYSVTFPRIRLEIANKLSAPFLYFARRVAEIEKFSDSHRWDERECDNEFFNAKNHSVLLYIRRNERVSERERERERGAY